MLGLVSVTPDSAKALIFYIFIYSFLTILLFSFLIFATISVKRIPAYISNWTATGVKNFVYALSFTLTLFSISGIPPLAGFFSKFLVLLAFIGNGYYFCATLIVIISSISAFYYLRLIKIFFFVRTSKNNFWISNKQNTFSSFILSFFMLFNLCLVFKLEVLSLFASVLSLLIV